MDFNIIHRISLFDNLFNKLQLTNSRVDKQYYVNDFLKTHPELLDDWTYILETLAGKHPIGWTFDTDYQALGLPDRYDSVKEWIMYLENKSPKTDANAIIAQEICGRAIGEFLEPIVNRTLRLGIGQSLLKKNNLSPMLAKKFEPNKAPVFDYIVTEKLNGNRCIAYYEEGKWHFVSRSGKKLNVNPDMTKMPTEYIYDGELLSYEQTQQSIKRTLGIKSGFELIPMSEFEATKEFSRTSGMVNDKSLNNPLVYNIFDIIGEGTAEERKKILHEILVDVGPQHQVRILPVLYKGKDFSLIAKILDDITFTGGEGLMLNQPFMSYCHDRSNALLKYKKVKTMDMYVLDTYSGTGKYENMVGALYCYLLTDRGYAVVCRVGSGLSDQQREDWWYNPKLIIGKVVEVGYQAISQSKTSTDKVYSLQFPRLLRVRTDKNKPSEY